MSKPVLSIGFDVPFDEAIKWGKERISVLPDVYYKVLPAQARSRAFTISGLSSLDQIQGVLDGLNRAVAEGNTFADWQKTVSKDALSLGTARLDNVFRTAIQTHYNIGRHQQQEENKKHRPFRMYDAINDGRTRPHHRAMDNYIAPIDDPIWRRWYPPNGFRCRCSTITLTEAQARQRGWIGTPKALPGDVQPDKGWDYNPAEGQDSSLKRVTSQNLGNLTDSMLRQKASEVLAKADGAKLSGMSMVGAVTPEFFIKCESAYLAMPEKVRTAIKQSGFDVVVADRIITVRPDLESVYPKGWYFGATFKNADGLSDSKMAIVAETRLKRGSRTEWENNVRAESVILHECGHAYDKSFEARISHTKEFRAAYKSDMKRLNMDGVEIHPYLKQSGLTGYQEVFAEVFASMHGFQSIKMDSARLFLECKKVIEKWLSI